MDIYVIIITILKYGLLALTGTALPVAFYAGGYLIYKKVFHGTKTLSIQQWVTLVLLSVWLLLVLGLTTFSRGANFTGSINTSLFSGYINAWHEWSYTELQLIIFNMLMFAPLGFLLPFLTKKGEHFSFVCLVSFLVTLFIEVLQFVSGRGIFELDDLLHNFIGSTFGYFVIMFFISCFREKKLKWRLLMRMLALPLIYVIGIGGAIIVYQNQEYGNMSIIPAEKQNMSMVSIENKAELSNQTEKVCVYKNSRANDTQYGGTIAEAIEELTGTEFKQTAHVDGKNKIFVSKTSNTQLTVFANNDGWTYTIWEEEKAALTEKEALLKGKKIEGWLNEHNLLSKNAVFSVQNNSILRWDVPTSEEIYPQESFASGYIMVEFNKNGEISNFHYFMIFNEYIKSVDVISEKEAYLEILDGNFEQYAPFEKGDILVVQDCILSYEYDTKGFLRPVYRFSGYINETDRFWESSVSAMK